MTLNPEHTPVFRRGYRLQWEQVQNSHVILYPEGMAKLNDSAAAILQLVDGHTTLNGIIAQLNARFPGAEGWRMTCWNFSSAPTNKMGDLP